MIRQAIEKLLEGEDLTPAEVEGVMEEVFADRVTPAQETAFSTALGMKGIANSELSAMQAAHARLSAVAGKRPPRAGYEKAFLPGSVLAAQLVLTHRSDLTRREADHAMEEILSGRADDTEIAMFLTALRFKGETVDEVAGFATAMRRHAPRIFGDGRIRADEVLVDTCGTGGDARGTFNISTATAFVVAGAGVRVAKHGNRSATSLCGSADVLEQLGMRIDLPPANVARAIEKVGIGFLFAPAMHSATRNAAKVRRELGFRTVFNLLGPLTNPAEASAQVVGVYDAGVTELMAHALGELGVKRAFVVHGADGLDEISISGETHVSELRDGAVRNYMLTPEDFGVRRAALEAIRGGDAKQNAEIIERIFGGSGLRGEHTPHRDIVLANASAALVAAGRVANFLQGVQLAAESIDSGAAREKLEKLIAFSNAEPGLTSTVQ
ncbi:MAG TPA: anthranilate phosphoribosyltransferase [Candidatus Acidoferrales bacterium]|nr:anthranilate phosphoribosyltransferase [Candidatus Acidoferrales bacterium]